MPVVVSDTSPLRYHPDRDHYVRALDDGQGIETVRLNCAFVFDDEITTAGHRSGRGLREGQVVPQDRTRTVTSAQ